MKEMVKLTITVIVFYSAFVLFMQFVFSFFNQSPYQERQLTLFNFAIPYIITTGFMIYGSILLFKRPTTIKRTKIVLCFVGLLEIISVKWQIEFLIWAINKKWISEITPILTGIIMTIYIFVTLLKIILKDKKSKQNSDSLVKTSTEF